MGDYGPDGPGDLYLTLRVRRDPNLRRDGEDLLYETEISFIDAIMGTKIEVPTVSGKAELKIPAGTQPETVFRLKGEGMPNIRSGRKGDELVTIKIKIPKNLNAKQKQLLEEFKKEEKKLFGVF
jgi:molecular chaperone DnaJ